MKNLDLDKLLKGKKPLSIAIDKQAQAIYFTVSDHEVCHTARLNDSLFIDYDKNNEPVGVELIRVSKIELILKKAFKDISTAIPSKVLAIT